jgi:hypothetical protein
MTLDQRIAARVKNLIADATNAGMAQWRAVVLAFLRKNPEHAYGTSLIYRHDPNKLIHDWGPDCHEWPAEVLYHETLPGYQGPHFIN